ncbi:DegV family protein [Microtetraspora sp. NBRC 16547]|uniref:DegV family protein n=1 Tax=Microtetraspora sp. NBRC 16547 TaxID=3030993 RepID=UPI0024A1B5F4|nr:DegV family protein [Microtetraspora sp. NBRC 16547]GLW97925.1 DegV domain-containing protein [Microtetraspora sp. NBRC 16547]
MPVAVVTDSTAYLDEAETAMRGIIVVPLHVVIGGREFDDTAEPALAGVAEALRDHAPVTTSQPAPQQFAAAYAAAAARGADGVVSVHLSGSLSGTAEAARLAAKDAPVPVEVVDSGSVGMGLGFPVLTAAEAARRGAGLADVASTAKESAAATRSFFYVDTLDYLRRGGRIGAAANLLGSALAIKPLLHLADGTITVLEKVRTANRAIARLEDLAVQAAGDGAVRVAVQHLGAGARARALADALAARVSAVVQVTVLEVGAVIGAHVGPGLLAVTIAPGGPQAS